MTDDEIVALAGRVARLERASDERLVMLARLDQRVTEIERAWLRLDRRVELVERALGDVADAVAASRAQLADVQRIAALLDDVRGMLDPSSEGPRRRYRQAKPF